LNSPPLSGALLGDLSVIIEAMPDARRVSSTEWSIDWAIGNQSNAPLALYDVRIPHDQFRGADISLEPPVLIPPADTGVVTSSVTYAEQPGSTLTYPFIIIQASWQGLTLRLFGRLRVKADERGAPHPICEAVTVRAIEPRR
jgi:hypothetical protein